ncbi:hypothetical protein [Nocardia sp. NBC_01009]|uniref:hypothetical protein n=1 Tax=Nocardia sp. NBC_01009 TaxID=2975996 RepID=UPI0038642DA1|nr:hypothetical protein OHA42_09955 [Nocardia sp. NBC_01009]
MTKIYRAAASLTAAAAIGVLGAGATGIVGIAVANAQGMPYDQCVNEAARKQADFDARQDPDATHATYPHFYCAEDGIDVNGNKLYVVTYSYNPI